jgi:bifunctional UDP-N-acetylglucosamine pyrophosphorylase/glucosamine-1-phosphate N-acetyltransferase
MAIRGVVFDLDGVLWDSARCHQAAFEAVFESLGIRGFRYSEYAGWRTEDVVTRVLEKAGRRVTPGTVASAVQAKRELAREALQRLNPVRRGCASVLEQLAQRYQLGLASSASRHNVEVFLAVNGFGRYFHSVLTGEDVQAGKPSPEIYARSFAELGLDPDQCVVVEDAEAGIVAAKAAGATAVGLTGTASREGLLGAGADGALEKLEELPAWLEQRRDGLASGIIPPSGWEAYAAPRVLPMLWTAVIPAAGRGSRMGFDKPKILYPVAGRTILEWLLELLLPLCESVVVVASPQGQNPVRRELEKLAPQRCQVVVQEEPTGMGDAVAVGLEAVRSLHVAVVWGDQVALRSQSVEACMRLHQGWLAPKVTCPTVLRPDPYIHFLRGPEGRICGVLQAREGDAMPAEGESDTGFFCFRSQVLRELLERSHEIGEAKGRRTGEFNLLPLIAVRGREPGAVITPRLMRTEETVGINSPDDVRIVEEFLLRSSGG